MCETSARSLWKRSSAIEKKLRSKRPGRARRSENRAKIEVKFAQNRPKIIEKSTQNRSWQFLRALVRSKAIPGRVRGAPGSAKSAPGDSQGRSWASLRRPERLPGASVGRPGSARDAPRTRPGTKRTRFQRERLSEALSRRILVDFCPSRKCLDVLCASVLVWFEADRACLI